MKPLAVLPVVLLSIAVGFCRGVLEQVHPLNEDFRKYTILMMYVFAAGLILCVVAGLLHGR